MSVDLKDLIGKTIDRIDEHKAIIFTDGTVLTWDLDGCEAIFTSEEWAQKWAWEKI